MNSKLQKFLDEQGYDIIEKFELGEYPKFPIYSYHHFKNNIVVEARRNEYLIICVLDDKFNAKGRKYVLLKDKTLISVPFYQENYLNI